MRADAAINGPHHTAARRERRVSAGEYTCTLRRIQASVHHRGPGLPGSARIARWSDEWSQVVGHGRIRQDQTVAFLSYEAQKFSTPLAEPAWACCRCR